MADTINERLEEMVHDFKDLEQKGIFSRAEIKKIIEKRRTFEYRLISSPSVHDYLKYIEYESALDQLRRQRKHELGWKKRTSSDNAGVQHIIVIFERAVAGQSKGDLKLWFQYIDFCLESGSVKQLQRVLLKALRLHPKEEKFWILAADRHLRHFHFKAARTMLLRALRFLPNRIRLWQQYLKLECLLGYFAQSHAPPVEPQDPVECDRAVSSTAPVASEDQVKHTSATLDVLTLVMRKGCAHLDEEDISKFLAVAHKYAMDYLKVVSAQHSDSWRRFAQDISRIVDDMLDMGRLSIWSLWWQHVGPRDTKAQLEVVLSRGSDEVLVNWMHACQNLDTVAEELASNERVRNNAEAVVALPLTTQVAQDCLRAAVSGKRENFALQVRLWSMDTPSAKDMLAACRTANIDTASAWAFLRGLPSEARVDGFLEVAFRVESKVCRSMTIQLLAFQLAVSIEAYRSCIARLTDLPKKPKSLGRGDHFLAIFDAILETETRLGTPGLEPLFDQACEMEKRRDNLVDLWTRYEVYVDGQGGDSANIRWRASRIVPAQALVDRKLEMSQL